MVDERTHFLSLLHRAVADGILRKLVLSQPTENAPAPRAAGKLCKTRAGRRLVLEYAYEGGRVSQTLFAPDGIDTGFAEILPFYRQLNLLTSAGDVELKTSRKGKMTLIGGERLERALRGDLASFATFDAPIDREKNRMLTGAEPFLFALGIADVSGRVHDKRQAKFRQINRFLEHLAGVYDALPATGALTVYDLCCGKSYLSFAVYHYLKNIRGRALSMVCVDLKEDVVRECAAIAETAGFTDMHFIAGDVRTAVPQGAPDLVISLHACDIATDIVLGEAIARGAKVILSTPCCHRYLSKRLDSPALAFVSEHPQLRGKLAEACTDALRLLRLTASGYDATALELTDPENTPKNTLLRAIRREGFDPNGKEALAARARYDAALTFLLGEGAAHYLEEL